MEKEKLEGFVKLGRAEIIEIVRDMSRPERGDLVSTLVPFLKQGIIGIGFSWGLEAEPIPEREQKVEATLHGLVAGERSAIEYVVTFIEEDGPSFSIIFRDYLHKMLGIGWWKAD
jgi:hypothetical protein